MNHILTVNVRKNDLEDFSVEHAIYCTTEAMYVQDDGSLGSSPCWKTDDGWGKITVTGLQNGTEYEFKVKSRNYYGHATESEWSSSNYATPGQETLLQMGGSCPTSGSAKGVFVHSHGSYETDDYRNFAYIADGQDGLTIIDVSDPASPTQVTTLALPGSGEAQDVKVITSSLGKIYAVVTDSDSGVHFVDVTDVNNPSINGSYSTSGDASGVDVTFGGIYGVYFYIHAYVACGASGIEVVEHKIYLSGSPTETSLYKSYNTSGEANNVFIYGGGYHGGQLDNTYAFIADGSNGLIALDITGVESNPSHDFGLKFQESTNGSCFDIFYRDDIAYLADSSAGLELFEITGLDNATTTRQFLSSYDTPGNALRVSVIGQFAYIADGTGGVPVINIDNPSSISCIDSWTTDSVHSVCINAGDPSHDYNNEPTPNGGRVNLGAYANTVEASMGNYSFILSFPTIRTLGVGGYLTLVAFKDSYTHSFGLNNWGQLGNGSISPPLAPNYRTTVSQSYQGKYIKLAAGEYHAVALTKDGKVNTWGYNINGQLGLGDLNNRCVPCEVPNLSNAVSIAACEHTSFALLGNGTVLGWGKNDSGNLGCDPDDQSEFKNATVIQGLSAIVQIEAGEHFLVARNSSGQILTLGENDAGQLGDGSSGAGNFRYTPYTWSGTTVFKDIAAGLTHTIALDIAGNLYCCGANGKGQLGLGNYDSKTTPTLNTRIYNVDDIEIGRETSFAIKGGIAYSWGSNDNGMLGVGSYPINLPQVNTPQKMAIYNCYITKIFPGHDHHGFALGYGLDRLAYLYGWGFEDYGQLNLPIIYQWYITPELVWRTYTQIPPHGGWSYQP